MTEILSPSEAASKKKRRAISQKAASDWIQATSEGRLIPEARLYAEAMEADIEHFIGAINDHLVKGRDKRPFHVSVGESSKLRHNQHARKMLQDALSERVIANGWGGVKLLGSYTHSDPYGRTVTPDCYSSSYYETVYTYYIECALIGHTSSW